mgnify:CR=1 FL=1
MIISSDGYYNPQLAIQLMGVCDGPAPHINLSTNNIFFGSVRINEHEDKEFTITNDGNSPLNISDFIFEENADNYEILCNAGLIFMVLFIHVAKIVQFNCFIVNKRICGEK